jgi:hypothetical protein
VWAIRFYLDQHRRLRDRALFDLAIDSKLRGCDVVRIKIGDLVAGGHRRLRHAASVPASANCDGQFGHDKRRNGNRIAPEDLPCSDEI